jgi:hypothetical protein
MCPPYPRPHIERLEGNVFQVAGQGRCREPALEWRRVGKEVTARAMQWQQRISISKGVAQLVIARRPSPHRRHHATQRVVAGK